MYDLNDVLNGIGGSLGLFLGMSLLGLADWAGREWKKRKRGRKIKRKLDTKGKERVDKRLEKCEIRTAYE